MSNELFKFSNIDKVRNKIISIKLEDKDGSEVEIEHVIEQVNSYINEQLASKEGNVMVRQIYPFISQILAQSLTKVVGSEYTAMMIVSQQLFRNAIMQEMLLSYYIMKFIQKNNIKIVSVEQDASDDQIDSILVKDSISSIGILAGMSGYTSKETIQALLNSGKVSEQDIINSNMFTNEQLKDILKKNEN